MTITERNNVLLFYENIRCSSMKSIDKLTDADIEYLHGTFGFARWMLANRFNEVKK